MKHVQLLSYWLSYYNYTEQSLTGKVLQINALTRPKRCHFAFAWAHLRTPAVLLRGSSCLKIPFPAAAVSPCFERVGVGNVSVFESLSLCPVEACRQTLTVHPSLSYRLTPRPSRVMERELWRDLAERSCVRCAGESASLPFHLIYSYSTLSHTTRRIDTGAVRIKEHLRPCV